LVAVRDLLFFVLEPVRLPIFAVAFFFSCLLRIVPFDAPTRTASYGVATDKNCFVCVSAVDCALFLLNDFTRRPFGFYSKVRRGLVAVDVSKIYQDPY